MRERRAAVSRAAVSRAAGSAVLDRSVTATSSSLASRPRPRFEDGVPARRDKSTSAAQGAPHPTPDSSDLSRAAGSGDDHSRQAGRTGRCACVSVEMARQTGISRAPGGHRAGIGGRAGICGSPGGDWRGTGRGSAAARGSAGRPAGIGGAPGGDRRGARRGSTGIDGPRAGSTVRRVRQQGRVACTVAVCRVGQAADPGGALAMGAVPSSSCGPALVGSWSEEAVHP